MTFASRLCLIFFTSVSLIFSQENTSTLEKTLDSSIVHPVIPSAEKDLRAPTEKKVSETTDPIATPVSPPLIIQKEDDPTRVAILGYHDFSPTDKPTEMRINTNKFREQMKAIKDMALPVISIEDFCAWKRGEKKIPPRSVVITIDDGWISVYKEAFPILKEYGYPFTLFLYTQYIDVQGRSMTSAMIKEMQRNGATIGSHSISHHYPSYMKKQKKKGSAIYEQYLRSEMGQSRKTLEEKFSQKIDTYCFPGGFYTDEMLNLSKELSYDFMFTVLPGKIKSTSDNKLLSRYIVMGNSDSIFMLATEFRNSSFTHSTTKTNNSAVKTIAFPVKPLPGEKISTRMPIINVDLSSQTNINKDTLKMKISGLGEVPAIYDSATKQFSWKMNRRLRSPSCEIFVTWNNLENKATETPLRWEFFLDKEAAYQPNE
jgi:peptidoglycan/xylan/chitin deacetylase (PgdA/CDA1 family)